MSTKWNNALRLQKTPKVCKKVPRPPPPETTTFHRYPLQAFATWSDSQTPLEQQISGLTTLEAFPDIFEHDGWIQGERASLHLVLLWNEITLQFLYTITLYIGGIPVKSVSVRFTDPPAALPFTAGLFTWDTPGLPEIVTSKIYS